MGCVAGEGLGARLCDCGVEETRAKHDAAAIQADTSRQAAADRERSRPVREATREGPCLVPSLGLLPYLLCRIAIRVQWPMRDTSTRMFNKLRYNNLPKNTFVC